MLAQTRKTDRKARRLASNPYVYESSRLCKKFFDVHFRASFVETSHVNFAPRIHTCDEEVAKEANEWYACEGVGGGNDLRRGRMREKNGRAGHSIPRAMQVIIPLYSGTDPKDRAKIDQHADNNVGGLLSSLSHITHPFFYVCGKQVVQTGQSKIKK